MFPLGNYYNSDIQQRELAVGGGRIEEGSTSLGFFALDLAVQKERACGHLPFVVKTFLLYDFHALPADSSSFMPRFLNSSLSRLSLGLWKVVPASWRVFKADFSLLL
jgi:hypothetical protein